MSDSCPIIMKETKEEKKEDSHPHFVKVIDYAKKELWRTDVILGQKGSKYHGHLVLSGAALWYLDTEEGEVIIENGNVVKNTSQSQLDYIPNTSEESQHPEKSHSENGDS